MSRGHHRHNNSLRRALLAQAGPQAYPYMDYSPTAYTPAEIGYQGIFNQGYAGYSPGEYGGVLDWIKKGGKAIGTFLAKNAGEIGKAGAGVYSNHMDNKTLESIAEADAKTQEEIARINAEANTKMMEMQYKFGGTSMSGWTILGIVGGVVVLGGVGFFVLRKRKK